MLPYQSKFMVTVQKLVLHLVYICSVVQNIESLFVAGRARFLAGRSRFAAVRSRFVAGRKTIKGALSAALKPTANQDLEPRFKEYNSKIKK